MINTGVCAVTGDPARVGLWEKPGEPRDARFPFSF